MDNIPSRRRFLVMISPTSVAIGIAIAGLLPSVLGTALPNPAQSDWATLNQTVGGRLFSGVPFAEPCFSSYNGAPEIVNQASCTYVEQNFFNSHLNRSNAFGGYVSTAFEMCMSTGDSCELDFSNPTNILAFAPPHVCRQGSIAPKYIDVQGESDVIAALNFVKTFNIPLTIKNTGHDYQGRSSAPNSLALWMHHLKGMTFEPAFVPDGCSGVDPQVAVTYQAGQQFVEVFQFAHDNNVTVIGGSDLSVGMAGGWNQGGGHSILSNTYGLGVDRILQYKVITTDGVARTVNSCQNSDLFYALRGGGGGTFAIVLEATSVASPATTYTVANLNWPKTPANHAAVVSQFVQNATNFALSGWGGYMNPNYGNFVLLNPTVNLADAQAAMQPLIDLTTSLGGVSTVYEVPSFLDWFNEFVSGVAGAPNAVGTPSMITSRFVPQALHDTEESRASLVEAISYGFNNSVFAQIHFTAPYGFNGTDGSDTSINPIWRESLYHVLVVNKFDYNSTLADRQAAYAASTAAIQPLRDLTPGGGTYHNEADVHEPDYEQSFWGPNYDTLLSIKNKYDPDHILDCWHCVGWQQSNPKYMCYI